MAEIAFCKDGVIRFPDIVIDEIINCFFCFAVIIFPELADDQSAEQFKDSA